MSQVTLFEFRLPPLKTRDKLLPPTHFIIEGSTEFKKVYKYKYILNCESL